MYRVKYKLCYPCDYNDPQAPYKGKRHLSGNFKLPDEVSLNFIINGKRLELPCTEER